MTTKQTILELVARQGLTDKQAAAFLGAPINTYHHWINGTRDPSAVAAIFFSQLMIDD